MLTILAFIFVVGTLVVIHELGHLVAARIVGVRVTTFAIGFPPNIFRRRVGETDVTIGLLPLGGYVRMAGGAPGEGTDDPREIQNRTRGERLAILLAGPAMNLILAILIMAGLFLFGIDRRVGLSDPPLVAYVAADSPAGEAGIREGDLIKAVDDALVSDWRSLLEEVAIRGDQEADFRFERGGMDRTLPVRIRSIGPDAFGDAGVWPPAPPLIGVVAAGTPAAAAGMEPGDLIVSVDDEPVGSTQEVSALVRAGGIRPIGFGIERESRPLVLAITPEWFEDAATGERWPRIGVQFQPPFRRVQAESVPEALREATIETTRWATLTLGALGRIFGGDASVRQLSGPIGIAQASGAAIRRGAGETLMLMAIISLSLGLLNLLPVPVLDGGQIAVLLVEAVARRDLSLRLRQILMYAGAAFMLLVFVVVIYVDLSKL